MRSTKLVTFRLDTRTIEALDRLAEEHQLSRTDVVELILAGKLITSEDMRKEIEKFAEKDESK
jgi:hypothetical protein